MIEHGDRYAQFFQLGDCKNWTEEASIELLKNIESWSKIAGSAQYEERVKDRYYEN